MAVGHGATSAASCSRDNGPHQPPMIGATDRSRACHASTAARIRSGDSALDASPRSANQARPLSPGTTDSSTMKT